MVSKTSLFSIAAMAAVGLAMSVSANAQLTIVQNFSMPMQHLPFTRSIAYNKFDTSLGTLTQVNWSMNTKMSVGVNVYSIDSGEQPYWSATATVPISFVCAGPATIITVATAGPFVGYAGAGGENYQGYPGYSVNTMIAPMTMSQTTVNINSANLGMYAADGAATDTVAVVANTMTTAGTGNEGVFFGGNATAEATVTLTYTYVAGGQSRLDSSHSGKAPLIAEWNAQLSGACPWMSSALHTAASVQNNRYAAAQNWNSAHVPQSVSALDLALGNSLSYLKGAALNKVCLR